MLSYVLSLDLPGPDAQIVAAVVAIRAARGGVGNVTGKDLSALRLDDVRGAVDALRTLGWQLDDTLFDGDPATPVPIIVPELAWGAAEHPLRFGKNMRSRVSGWTARTLSAKPVRKLPPAARLAGLFLAAHGASEVVGPIPPSLPASCRAALPDLLRKGFLAELTADGYRLDVAVGHLSGNRPVEEEPAAQPAKDKGASAPAPEFQFDPATWAEWKKAATPALQRHVEAVEFCAICAIAPQRVAEAFMERVRLKPAGEDIAAKYEAWKESHADRGPQAAEFTVAFRTEHGHGPSYTQLCSGLRWKAKRSLRGLIVEGLLADGWLTDTSPVPWTLRPGKVAQAQGITLPKARASDAASRAGA
ncbi:hypothetical protein [Streptomyces sp. NPDC046821]|uniref:hypothetical protein n=1 Tax=Streptomyces sp. NPDC046821 TaxID=3154702 RepID=UPI0033DD281B